MQVAITFQTKVLLANSFKLLPDKRIFFHHFVQSTMVMNIKSICHIHNYH